MADQYALCTEAWRIHDVLQTLAAALPADGIECEVPVQGVVSLLVDLAHGLAESLSNQRQPVACPNGEFCFAHTDKQSLWGGA